MSQSDQLYAEPRAHLVDFAFDQSVAAVFPDMIRRSVPGYETVISVLGLVAEQYYQHGHKVYDLGCSLGAATLSIFQRLGTTPDYVAVDSAAPMLARCRENLGFHMADARVSYHEMDIRDIEITGAGVVVLNFTLQFLPPEDRQVLLERIHAGLEPGGVLILSEKVRSDSELEEETLTGLHHRFKTANGYSELEISQKRSALENVMQLDTVLVHRQRLERAGFRENRPWFQCLNFVSLLAVK